MADDIYKDPVVYVEAYEELEAENAWRAGVMGQLRAIVAEQAEDANLWRVVDASLFEEYLQQALRRLHAAIEEERT